ncbi:MAG: PDGLE domain-containing protein [Nitrospirae bacterium]|nr:PDGLE domain-containing protein [Nitrospirota bacterium]
MRNEKKGEKRISTAKKLWIGIGILALLSPLGLIIPQWFGSEGAWGEWGSDTIEKMVGFMPQGMKRLAQKWEAPMMGYAVPGQGRGLTGESFGYIITGIIGIALTSGLMFLIAKALIRKKNGR